jgi:EmrB/QacA subfamily drug resistance transporter
MDKQNQASSAEERSALFVATLTSFMGPFMISSVNVALPVIQNELKMDAVELSWIATAYLLAVAVFLLPSGKVADIHGRKRVFGAGLVVYTVGATAAAFANSATALIVLRVIQGMGAAMFVSTGMAILTSIFPPQRRGRVIGIYVAAVYIGLSAGPFVGGYITNYLGWRMIFMLMLPMGALSVWLTLRYLKGEWYGEPGQKLDIPGCVLYGLSIMSLIYGATCLPALIGILLIISGFTGLTSFIYHQRRSKFPIFQVELFAVNKVFAYSSYAALLNYSATFGVTFLVSLYLQFIKGLSPQTAGTVLMAQPVVMAILSPIAGRLSDRVEPRLLATTGMVITVAGVLIFSQLQPATPLPVIIANLIFLGTGFALFSSPNMSAMMGAVEKKHYGLASGLVATMRLLGQMFSMAVATVVLAMLVGREAIAPANFDRFLLSIQTVFMISASFCLIGTYFSWYRGRIQVSLDPGENQKNI